MIDIEQFILLMIYQQTEELEEFKDYIKKSKSPSTKNAFGVWESIYLKWAIAKEDVKIH